MQSTPPSTPDNHAYRVDLNLHHPVCDPTAITQELALTPWFARKQGDTIAGIKHRSTSWLCHFQRGSGNDAFDQTLRDLVSFTVEHRSFFQRFADEHGTAELVLNATVSFDDGKILDLSLDPQFLKELSQAHLRLRLQVWSKDEDARLEMS